MTADELQSLCERGQEELMRMRYLEAAFILADAERQAWAMRDWDALSRLYMPLQEARRQIRQRAGEGIVCLDLLAEGPDDVVDPLHVMQNFSHGQLLVAGWGTIEPALRVRQLAKEHGLFLETFLAAAYPSEGRRLVAIIPLPQARLPEPEVRTIEELRRLLPTNSILVPESELSRGSRRGTFQTYGQVMALWESLHTPFLRSAHAEPEPIARMEGYRLTTHVDEACELAHQKLSDVAREMLRNRRVARKNESLSENAP